MAVHKERDDRKNRAPNGKCNAHIALTFAVRQGGPKAYNMKRKRKTALGCTAFVSQFGGHILFLTGSLDRSSLPLRVCTSPEIRWLGSTHAGPPAICPVMPHAEIPQGERAQNPC